MDQYLIDTNSMRALAKYFHPFDSDKNLSKHLQDLISSNALLIHNSMLVEGKRIRRKEEAFCAIYDFLGKTRPPIRSVSQNDFLQNNKIQNKLNQNWQRRSIRKDMSEEGFEAAKNQFIASPDFQLIYHALRHRKEGNISIVTEESRSDNDGKLYKKIPTICDQEKIRCMNIAAFLKNTNFKIDYPG